MKIFTLVFGIMYCVAFYMEWALFRYYPETNAFHLAMHPEDGPAILWYGWLAFALVVSAVAGLIVPSRLVDRLWSGLFWVVPVGTVLVVLFYEKRWFL